MKQEKLEIQLDNYKKKCDELDKECNEHRHKGLQHERKCQQLENDLQWEREKANKLEQELSDFAKQYGEFSRFKTESYELKRTI